MIRVLLTVSGFSLIAAFILTGCEKQELNDLAVAQKCLDDVPSSNPAAAEACFQYVAKYTSQQADILKCSIKLTGGGLSASKIVAASKVAKDSGVANKESLYVAYLALDDPDRYERAKIAYQYCLDSQLTDLEFVGGLAKVSSMLAEVAGGNFDINDPSGTASAIADALDDCVTNPGGSGCDMDDVGETVASISEAYCSSASSDEDVCTDINDAIAEAGGDATEAAKHFMCKLQNKTYNGTSCI